MKDLIPLKSILTSFFIAVLFTAAAEKATADLRKQYNEEYLAIQRETKRCEALFSKSHFYNDYNKKLTPPIMFATIKDGIVHMRFMDVRGDKKGVYCDPVDEAWSYSQPRKLGQEFGFGESMYQIVVENNQLVEYSQHQLNGEQLPIQRIVILPKRTLNPL